MAKISRIKKILVNWKKLSWRKVVKYSSIFVGTVILICLLVFIFFPGPFINSFVKNQITKTFTEAYPGYTIQLGDMHYNVWKNLLACDSISLTTSDFTFSGHVDSFSVSGISWFKIFMQRNFTMNNLASAVIDAQNIILNFHQSQNKLLLSKLYVSAQDSIITADSVKYFPTIDDEQFFERSEFKQTRYRLDIPQIKILGMDCISLLKENIYSAKSINIHGLFADILVNMDKPDDKNSPNPKMPNEALASMEETIKVDSFNIFNGQLKYSERNAIGKKPGVITFNQVNVSVRGIANRSELPDTTVIYGEGVFMNSGKMKLFMTIPLTSSNFSLHYSGSLGAMDATELNAFVEPAEHRRIKSGVLQSAMFDINVNSGYANGSLRVLYKDVSFAVLNKDTGSEDGIINQMLSTIGKVFIIRRTNMPDEKGLMKIGEIKYTRNPDDTFLQFIWFALRGGVADVLGFPRK